MLFLKTKKVFFLIFIIIVVLLSFYLFFLEAEKNGKNQQPESFPTPTPFSAPIKPNDGLPPIPGQSEEYKKSAEDIGTTVAPILKKDSIIGDLLNKLPYFGSNFSISYDYGQNQFKVVVASDEKIEGEKEFNDFLKTNRIDNRSWFDNLIISYQ